MYFRLLEILLGALMVIRLLIKVDHILFGDAENGN